MITDRIFISSSTSDEGESAVRRVTEGLRKIKRSYDKIDSKLKLVVPTRSDKQLILDKITECGVTILVLSSDFLEENSSLLKRSDMNQPGWNYEELKNSLIWNKEKMHNSIVVTYTDEFFKKYLEKPYLFSFPIIHDNINNLNKLRACDNDSNHYIEVLSLTEFLSKPKLYLNRVDIRKFKQSKIGLYNLKYSM